MTQLADLGQKSLRSVESAGLAEAVEYRNGLRLWVADADEDGRVAHLVLELLQREVLGSESSAILDLKCVCGID